MLAFGVLGRARAIDTEHEQLDGAAAEMLWEDENTKVIQGLLVEVSEAYAHCPRAFLFSKLWDVERLRKSIDDNPNRYWFDRWRESMAPGELPGAL